MKLYKAVPDSENVGKEIHARLRAYNRAHREMAEELPICFYYADDDGEKRAGIVAEIFGRWLCIHYLFVEESLRGQGIGKELLREAENEARAHGCRHAFVDTFDFQAPDFYKKQGYTEVFALRDYPVTGTRYYYTKEL